MKIRKYIPVVVLTGLSAYFYADSLFLDRVFAFRDLSRYFFPLREFTVNVFRSGTIPLWNPYVFCGVPHLALQQSAVFYPLSAIYHLFPYHRAFNIFIAVHTFLAGVFTYLLCRRWKLSMPSSLLSAMTFMFSGYLVSVISMLSTFSSVVWLGAAILCFDRALLDKGALFKVLAPLVPACMFLGGEPSVFYITSSVLFIYSVFLQRGSASGVTLKKVVFAYLAVIAGAVLLSSFQGLPLLELLRHSDRVDPFSGSVLYETAAKWSLPLKDTLNFVFPFFARTEFSDKAYWVEQNWVLFTYAGIFSPALVLLSYIRRKDWRVKFLFFTGLFFLLVSYGKNTPVHYILYRVAPGFGFIRYPARFLFVVTFCVSILSGFGLDVCVGEIRERWSAKLSRRCLAAFFAAALLLAALAVNAEEIIKLGQAVYSRFNSAGNIVQVVQMFRIDMFNIQRLIGYLIGGGMILFLGMRGKIRMSVACFAVISLAAVDIMGTSQFFMPPSAAAAELYRKTPGIEHVAADRSLFRVYASPKTVESGLFLKPRETFGEALEDLKDKFISDWPMLFGLYDASGYDSLYLASHTRMGSLIGSMGMKDGQKMLSMMNIKYIALIGKVDVAGYKLVSEGSANIYENLKVLPRAFLVDSYKVLKKEGEIAARLGSREFEPEREVILEEEPVLGVQRTAYSVQRKESVEIVKYTPNEVVIKAAVGGKPKILFLSDTYYPGWKVNVDGNRGIIYKANYAFRAVYLGPGEHTVRFVFDPFTFKLGAAISLVTLAGIVAYSIYYVRKRRDKTY